MPIFNETVLHEYIEDIGSDKAGQLLDIVLKEIKLRQARALKNYQNKDMDGVKREYHTMKSVCAMIGAESLSEVARNIEQNIETMRSKALEEQMRQFEIIKDETAAYIMENYLAAPS